MSADMRYYEINLLIGVRYKTCINVVYVIDRNVKVSFVDEWYCWTDVVDLDKATGYWMFREFGWTTTCGLHVREYKSKKANKKMVLF